METEPYNVEEDRKGNILALQVLQALYYITAMLAFMTYIFRG